MTLAFLRVLATGSAIALVTGSCQRETSRDNAPSNEPRPAAVRRSRLVPLSWSGDSSGLIVARVDQQAIDDVGQVACDSTGLYQRSRSSRLAPRAIGAALCQAVWPSTSLSLSHDGTKLLVVSTFAARDLKVVDLRTSTGTRVATPCSATQDVAVWSPRADRIAAVMRCGPDERADEIVLLDAEKGNHVSLGRVATGQHVTGLSWSPDGAEVAVSRNEANGRPEIAVVNVQSKREHRIATGSGASWSPDGRWIAYVANDTASGAATTVRRVRPDGTSDQEVWKPSPDTTQRSTNTQHLSGPIVWSPRSDSIAIAAVGDLWLLDALHPTPTPVRLH
jgi:Tol biopolymer transport system component